MNWQDNVRITIQRHCSQTKSYRGSSVTFYSVYRLGEGICGLKNYNDLTIINIDTARKYIPKCSKEMKQNLEYHADIIYRH